MDLQEMNVFGTSKSFLSHDKILEILKSINDALERKNKCLSITIYGGSCLCLITKYRESTYDIDVLTSDNSLLKECIREIGLSDDIVNTDIEVFLNKSERLNLYKRYSNLEVFVPSLDYLLAMKIRASREKDANDIKNLIEELNIKTLKELRDIFVKYYSPIQFNEHRIKFIKECIK
ncbi:DUF6036 family nucleotidyltransferase [uncultured Clostridium sp.]|uniref:DUF6036 family nucleotidyltransferase n=1 Tax=uncultured Clostridium sp. TaxID=59620 RepID=UPI0026F3FCBA|nr:DUF6036 family nucleotidyltransferase [uncultured Clostridium sp.]